MFWIALVLIVAGAGSIGGFVDNYAADVVFKKNRPEVFKVVSIFAYAILMLIAACVFGIENIGFWHALLFILAGSLDALGNIPYFKALKYEETTSITIIRQIGPVLALIMGVMFLNQAITWVQLIAFLFILGAAGVVVFAKSTRGAKFESRMIGLMLLAIFIWVVSDIIFVADFVSASETNLFTGNGIWTALFWFALGKGSLPFVLGLTLKSWRRRLKRVWKDSPRQFTLSAIGGNLIRVATDGLWRFTTTIAPLALASVIGSVTRLLFTFGFGLAFSLIWPVFGRETVTRKAVLYHLIGVVLAVIGVILLQANLADPSHG
ncbi:EamA family transporter [Candidatus Saccharibacteria bacterium]|nr:EamA family transporter [Candidatus Saccharibacteria bacterium]